MKIDFFLTFLHQELISFVVIPNFFIIVIIIINGSLPHMLTFEKFVHLILFIKN